MPPSECGVSHSETPYVKGALGAFLFIAYIRTLVWVCSAWGLGSPCNPALKTERAT